MKKALKNKIFSWGSILHPLDTINNAVGYAGIKAKNIGEDIGLFGKDQFTTTGSQLLP